MIYLDEFRELDCTIYGAAPAVSFTDFSYDSRLTSPGELFIALKTPYDDGDNYIPAAIKAGATGIICRQNLFCPGKYNVVVIETGDPLLLVQKWAANRLQKVKPLVVAITGSLGKTSAKHAVATLLSKLSPTFESRQNFNSLLGLPLTLAQLNDTHQYAVLEMASNSFGEIGRLAALFPPQIAVVTNVAKVHLKMFGSLDRIASEKSALIRSLPPDGLAFLNGDDPLVMAMKDMSHPAGNRFITFGQKEHCDLTVTAIEYFPERTKLCLHWKGNNELIPHPPGTIELETALIGTPAVGVVLAATGVALARGMSLPEIADHLRELTPVNGRLRHFSLSGNITLIDDTYSASLPSTMAALETMQKIPAQKRIMVLGELEDMGDNAGPAYQELGLQIGRTVDYLICKGDVGVPVVNAARQLNPELNATIVYTSTAALSKIRELIYGGDPILTSMQAAQTGFQQEQMKNKPVQKSIPEGQSSIFILIKGDRSARLEKVVKKLLPDELKKAAGNLLVRQEASFSKLTVRSEERPTWVTINPDYFTRNLHMLKKIAKVPLMIVVKADAYGHGAVRMAHTAVAAGAAALAVATLFEAKILRAAAITAPILILGYTPAWQAREVLLNNLTCTIFNPDVARALSDSAVSLRRNAKVHVKVDTGMGRLGLQPEEVVRFLKYISQLPNLTVEGLYTHLATADSRDQTFARLQLERFNKLLAEIAAVEKAEGLALRPPVVHAANSAAIFNFPEARFDMVRPGISCYGLDPSEETPLPEGFYPVLSFYTQIAQLKKLPPGIPLSYGGIYTTMKDPTIIATIPVGYADGLKRCPPWREVLVRGRRAKVVGRICMDYALIDVTEVPDVKCGDQVVLIGKQGDDQITATEVAGWLNTINYEVVSTILPRVPRDVVE